MDKGQYINLEYARNILLSFIESKTRVQLIPVLAQVLSLSHPEIERVKKVVAEESKGSAGFAFF